MTDFVFLKNYLAINTRQLSHFYRRNNKIYLTFQNGHESSYTYESEEKAIADMEQLLHYVKAKDV